jgi:predicted transposase/invertase (TIGR01784 family)
MHGFPWHMSGSTLIRSFQSILFGHSCSAAVLLEHQSEPDRWMRWRLLRYCCRIWEADRRNDPARSGLRPIVPVVFYQGARGWNHSTEFADLFPEAVRSLSWVPRFAHELLDQTTLEPEAVAGNVKGRIAQLLMMVAFGRHMEAALDWAARWTLSLRQAEGGVDEFRRFIVYLAAVQDDSVIETFSEALERHGLDLKGEIMTYAEQLLAEGRAEGEAKGEQRTKVQIVEGLLQAGVTWEVIEAATGLTEAGFEALKAQLAGSDAAP